MKIIHAVIRKPRPRARHPDEVRNTNCLFSKENNRCAKSYAILCVGAGVGHGSRSKSHPIARGHRGRCVESGRMTASLRKVCAGAMFQSFTSLGILLPKDGRNSIVKGVSTKLYHRLHTQIRNPESDLNGHDPDFLYAIDHKLIRKDCAPFASGSSFCFRSLQNGRRISHIWLQSLVSPLRHDDRGRVNDNDLERESPAMAGGAA